ncbi:TonB-dependent receptor [Desulfobacter hydrogenophilus]|uniref:TonB-dependent receptor n=1 Tax=Desulfobacter hydrogenophilus TaxID=2291 RepID=UPI001F5E9245|nr:TonB-dependent receptor [Desulfobacter hydrogenophilus]
MKIKNLDFSLTVNNIFDKEYISIINTTDYKTLGSTYQTGAPFTVYASVSVTF